MSSYKYIAILGRQPELGLVELESLLGSDGVVPFGAQAALLAEMPKISQLGGSIKLARILDRGAEDDLSCLIFAPDVYEYIKNNFAQAGKLPFGLSSYGRRVRAHELRAAGAEYKRSLTKTLDRSIRYIAPRSGETELSAAQLGYNQVLSKGFELVVSYAKGEAVVAATEQIQDIDWYSRRDYDRPARSAKVGMLPPKLAQVLVNSVKAEAVFDPFCGTGVVLQEALLMGRAAAGSDVASEMVDATEQNIAWLDGESTASLPKWSVSEADARTVKLPTGCAVVSEGYLGPNQTHSPTVKEVLALRGPLLELYRAALRNFAMQLPANGEVSICVPVWRVGAEWQYLGLVDELADLGYTLKGFKHVRSPLLYARGDTIVGRQLLLLRKI